MKNNYGHSIWTVIVSFIVINMLLVSVSCGQKTGVSSDKAYVFSEPATDEDGEIKILLYYDMEGISGQNDLRSLSYPNQEYFAARELLTNDVNAVIEGLFAGGADFVDVVDAHGSGNPEPDILVDKMDKRANLIDRDKSFRPYCDLTERDKYDGVAVVCMHSKTGGGGFAAHTYTLGMDWIFNDMSINETEIIAYSWGRADVPVIFASGDNKLKEQLEYLPWIEYVIVKYAKGASDADLRPLNDVYSEMTKKAVNNISKASVVNFTYPVKASLRAVHPSSLEILNGVPGINYEDNTVTFEAKNYQEAYDGITKFISIATKSWQSILHESIRNSNNSSEIYDDYSTRLFNRWGDVESGRWKAPESSSRAAGNKKYFGVK